VPVEVADTIRSLIHIVDVSHKNEHKRRQRAAFACYCHTHTDSTAICLAQQEKFNEANVGRNLEVSAPLQVLHDGLLAGSVRLGLHHLLLGEDGVLAASSSISAEPKERNSLRHRRLQKEAASTDRR
jgi:hypothetical protein